MKTKNLIYLITTCLIIGISLNSCSSDEDRQPSSSLDCSTASGQIPRDQAVQMVDDYVQIREAILSANIQYTNASGSAIELYQAPEVKFSIEEMKCYIEYIESFDGQFENLGIRAYLAAEPFETDDPNTPGIDYNTTIIFVPTGDPITPNGSKMFSDQLNISGADALNHGSAGIPPRGQILTNP